MAKEHDPILFEVVEKQLQQYLEDPTNDDPAGLVNEYFCALGLGKQTADEAQQLLFDTRSRLLTPRLSDCDPRFGNPGTITMRLPYFYPLHSTLFGWYTESEINIARDSNSEEKKLLAQRLREDAVVYCLIADERARVDRRVTILEPKLDMVKPVVVQSTLPWYKILNPFRK